MKAIDTRYKGYFFRSRTEARWAIVFDELGLKWEYEVEGYQFEDGSRYLPDFKIYIHGSDELSVWVEVKGTPPTTEEINKLHNLCVGTKKVGYFFVGQPGNHEIIECCLWLPVEHSMESLGTDSKAIDRALFIKKKEVGTIIERAGLTTKFAIEKAQEARFEFGGNT